MTPIPFRETQRFRQLWLWLPLLALMALAAYAFIQQLVLGHPVGTRPLPDGLAWVLLPLLGLGVPGGFAMLRLETRLEADHLLVRFFPLRTRRIPYRKIASAEAVTYRPLLDYGGWGIRLGAGGWAYTVSGRRGVRLTFSDGTHLLVGSQAPEALVAALQPQLEGSTSRPPEPSS